MKIKTITCEKVSGKIQDNPNNLILDFEERMLNFLCEGKDYQHNYKAVLVDSATNAIELCCMVNKMESKFNSQKIEIPNQTYISVKNVIHRYNKIELVDIEWDNYYQVHNIIDSAGYLPIGELPNIFGEGFNGIDYVVLSFGNSKPFPMNKGGLIIFKKDNMKIKSLSYTKKLNEKLGKISRYSLLKRLSHDGRDSALKVEDDTLLEINGKNPAMKCNLVPEQVKDGLFKLLDENFKSNLRNKHRKGHLKNCCSENYPKINKDL
jgi:hypothetical protein